MAKKIDAESKSESGKPILKYPKPKVLLIDAGNSVASQLILDGFNITSGTFGKPYRVPKGDGFQPLVGRARLPNYNEQEIVVVDLVIRELEPGPDGEKHTPQGEIDIWAKTNKGFIDPRPRYACEVSNAFDRILSTGGVFVVFADAKTGIELVTGHVFYRELQTQAPFPYDAWNFLPALFSLDINSERGEEIFPSDTTSALGKLVREHLPKSHFSCTITPVQGAGGWSILATNKFNEPVGVVSSQESVGTIIVLPQLADKAGFLTKLFKNILPELAPHLFPHIEAGRWTYRPEYELPKIIELTTKQAEVEKQAMAEISELEQEITNERTANGWIHDLLTGTDSILVEAVKKAFATLGFKKITDVDIERDKEGKSRREDLQIDDQKPTLIVDIKGVGGFPSDDDALQANKHATIRMREWKRTDVMGLSIVNHQRHLPPLERENSMPFRQELLDAASESSLGLMTAWDLYRLVRNFQKNNWPMQYVQPLFYKESRIEIIPKHYKFIGIIAKVWSDKFGIVIEQDELAIGDGLAIEFPIEFEETVVNSIQVNSNKVERAKAGDQTGLLWAEKKPKIREGMRVFRLAR